VHVKARTYRPAPNNELSKLAKMN